MAGLTEATVLDKPDQIEGYRILATAHGLALEIGLQGRGWPPTGGPTRGMALASARRILDQYEVPGGRKTRRQCLVGIRLLCQALGIELNIKETT